MTEWRGEGRTNKKWTGHSVPKGRGPWGQLQTLEQSPVCSRNLKLPIRSLSIRNRRTCTSEVSSSSKIGAGGRAWPRGGLLALLAWTLAIKVGIACSRAGI